jgi:hypothetical protein
MRTLIARALPGDGGPRGSMPPPAAVRELAEGVRRLPGVQGVRVRSAGTAARPRLAVTVVCAEETDLAALYTALEKGPAGRCRILAEMPDLPVVVRFKVVYRRPGTF